jgi:alanyl-tRNA synthetase
MTANEIRQSFIDFFKDKEHTFVPSSPVVPADDPTLLFTNAGMNQFKDVLLGTGTRPYTRAVNSQKCIRVSGKHNDLEEVGHDTYHHTLFEMLGNWSFGDYYKADAIRWAWELLTDKWNLPKAQLYATVFREDDESAELWKQVTDIDPERILRFDEKDNFWEMGETGPCGPCSEIHIDLGPDRCDRPDEPHTCNVNGDCARYIELWNLVFIQYNRDEKGQLNPLPARHVDTGAGFERLVAVLQAKESNYDTDLFTPILSAIGELVGTTYEQSSEKVAFRVIADHIRMLTFSIADGGFPSNEGRGYVMRRILRRAARYGRKLSMHEPFMFKLVDTVTGILGDSYPEIRERSEHIKRVIHAEEEHFNRTLDRGLEIFDRIKESLKKEHQILIPGEEIFKLYDTYGFPVDLTRILAEEAGLKIDQDGFEKAMHEQQERARKAARFHAAEIKPDAWVQVVENGSTNFVGYQEDAIETHVLKYAIHEDRINIVLKDTPFYAESGGQIGDHGIIASDDFQLDVIDTQKENDQIVHICRLPADFELKTDRVFAEIDIDNRRQTEKNHTATHLLHAALRTVLGDHVQQAGSLVEPDRLRFDFTHHGRVEETQLQQIETIVNQKIQEDLPLEIAQESFKSARNRGAMALFGEKYGEVVRTIQIADYSLELCGGTHVSRTGQIGLFMITSESSIASGVRRIEAITGRSAVDHIQKMRRYLEEAGAALNVAGDELPQKVRELLDKKKQIEKDLDKLNAQMLSGDTDSILANAETINGTKLIIYRSSDAGLPQLKDMGDQIRQKASKTIALLGSTAEGKLGFVCVVTDDLVAAGKYNAGELVRKVAGVAGGGGGGRPHMATAGGKDLSKFDEAMEAIRELI